MNWKRLPAGSIYATTPRGTYMVHRITSPSMLVTGAKFQAYLVTSQGNFVQLALKPSRIRAKEACECADQLATDKNFVTELNK